MLKSSTRKLISEHKWNRHSNESQFFKRIEEQSRAAIKDLTLLAEHLEEQQLKEIFTNRTLEPLLRAILIPKEIKNKKKDSYIDNDRIFHLCWMFLRFSLWITKRTISNKLAKSYYSEHEKPLVYIVDTLYQEKIRN